MPSSFAVPRTTLTKYDALPLRTYLTTLTASTSASLIYTGLSSANYTSYDFVFSGLLPVGSVDVGLRVYGSTDGGITYSSLWYRTNHYQNTSFAWTVSNAALAGFVTIAEVVEQVRINGVGMNGHLELSYPPLANYPSMFTSYICAPSRTSNRPTLNMTGAMFFNSTTTELNTLKFQFDAGNIQSGSIRIYGII